MGQGTCPHVPFLQKSQTKSDRIIDDDDISRMFDIDI